MSDSAGRTPSRSQNHSGIAPGESAEVPLSSRPTPTSSGRVSSWGRDVSTDLWTYVASSDEVPDALRDIAKRLEADDACLIGLWSTGFGPDSHAVIQVVIDPERNEP